VFSAVGDNAKCGLFKMCWHARRSDTTRRFFPKHPSNGRLGHRS
jgi:hypothetical protein